MSHESASGTDGAIGFGVRRNAGEALTNARCDKGEDEDPCLDDHD
jgi:hypothetical protein